MHGQIQNHPAFHVHRIINYVLDAKPNSPLEKKKVATSLSEAAATAGAAKIQLNKYKTFDFVFIVGGWASRKWRDSTSPGNTAYILRREDQQEEEEEGGDQ